MILLSHGYCVSDQSVVHIPGIYEESFKKKRSCEIENLLKTHVCKPGVMIRSRILRGA